MSFSTQSLKSARESALIFEYARPVTAMFRQLPLLLQFAL
jgi:hypothetical protein